MKLFDENIDFNQLQSEAIKEDTIREEIIAPILKALGYSAFSDNKIIRSKNLEHPYVQFGTTSKKVYIIPDYILQVQNKNAFIIDAKNPRENILSGTNPEQAYSYAMHKEVRVDKYVLCNGIDIVIFDVNELKPVFKMQVKDLEENWDNLYKILSPMAFTNPHFFNYNPDLGIRLWKWGMPDDMKLHYYDAKILDVAKVNEKNYSFSLAVSFEEVCIATFDFENKLFDAFMNQVPESKKEIVYNALTRQPFRYVTEKEEDSFGVSFSAVPSWKLEYGIDEVFMPFLVREFY